MEVSMLNEVVAWSLLLHPIEPLGLWLAEPGAAVASQFARNGLHPACRAGSLRRMCTGSLTADGRLGP